MALLKGHWLHFERQDKVLRLPCSPVKAATIYGDEGSRESAVKQMEMVLAWHSSCENAVRKREAILE
ncbi:hypothetical protein Y1Q_0005698 [Alligator mississippiensis]|uniref:Uncharacterized protein n=1 Tax=Alligator mississippiensis TaxID=8496 RepID=A0A151MFJ7_ALLMI|nr:hypothetical protein Y1Q_0005698 [Alligator mississippiensis]